MMSTLGASYRRLFGSTGCCCSLSSYPPIRAPRPRHRLSPPARSGNLDLVRSHPATIWSLTALCLVGCDGPSSGADQLPGPADALALPALPDREAPPHPQDDWLDLGAATISRSRVIVALDEAATVGQANDLLAHLGARILGAVPELGWLELEVEGSADAAAVTSAVATAEEHEGVGAASLDFLPRPANLPPAHEIAGLTWSYAAGAGSSSWHLQAIGAPAAWNLRDRLVRARAVPPVVVLDQNFHLDHEDLASAFDSGSRAMAIAPREHGTAVASVIGAAFDGRGVEGVLPVTPRLLALDVTCHGSSLAEVGKYVLARPELRLINSSMGLITYLPKDAAGRITGQLVPLSLVPGAPGHSWIDEIRRAGRMYARWLVALEARGVDLLVIAAAGNSGVVDAARRGSLSMAEQMIVTTDFVYEASEESGWAAAAELVPAAAPHVLAVEALDRALAQAPFSNRAGQMAAPGVDVGVAWSAPSGYRAVSGTSFSAPLVTGAAALLWALEPSLSRREVRDLLCGVEVAAAARTGTETCARRADGTDICWSCPRGAIRAVPPALNLVGAVQRLASLKPDAGILRDLADVDDGTTDGNMRVDPATGAPTPAVAARGDGCVDMRDLRALRDALLIAAGDDAGLDGDPFHPRRDLNGDGVVFGAPSPPTRTAPAETAHSRFDLDLDGTVDADDALALAGVWGSCVAGRSPRLEGRSGAGVLSELSETSADFWVRVPADRPSTIATSTGGGRRIVPGTSAIHGGLYAVVTARVRCGSPMSACVVDADIDGRTRNRCSTFADVAAGRDEVAADARLLAPEVPLVYASYAELDDQARMHFRTSDMESDYQLRGHGAPPFFPSPDGLMVGALDPTIVPATVYLTSVRSGLVDAQTIPDTARAAGLMRWSPDAGHLTHIVQGTDGATHLHLYERGGSGGYTRTEILGVPIGNTHPALDDTWLYFNGYDGELYRIATSSLRVFDSGGARCRVPVAERLTFTEGTYANPVLLADAPSPVGGQGVLVQSRTGRDEYYLGLLMPDRRGANNAARIAFLAPGVGPAAWSSDGQQVAFMNHDDGGGAPTGTFVIDLGIDPELDARVARVADASSGGLAWSPDGQQLMIRVIPTDGSPPTISVATVSWPPIGDRPTFAPAVSAVPHEERWGDPAWTFAGEVAVVQEFEEMVPGLGSVWHSDVVLVGPPLWTARRLSAGLTFVHSDGSTRSRSEGWPAGAVSPGAWW